MPIVKDWSTQYFCHNCLGELIKRIFQHCTRSILIETQSPVLARLLRFWQHLWFVRPFIIFCHVDTVCVAKSSSSVAHSTYDPGFGKLCVSTSSSTSASTYEVFFVYLYFTRLCVRCLWVALASMRWRRQGARDPQMFFRSSIQQGAC